MAYKTGNEIIKELQDILNLPKGIGNVTIECKVNSIVKIYYEGLLDENGDKVSDLFKEYCLVEKQRIN